MSQDLFDDLFVLDSNPVLFKSDNLKVGGI